MQLQPQHKLCISGGHVFDPAQNIDGILDIFIENERIVAIGSAPQGFTADTTIDASGKKIFPGFIDLHSFLAEPGFSQKGSIASETKAAAQSGFTTICCTPNTKPVIDSPAVAALIQEKAKKAGHCTVLTLGALTANLEGEQLSNMSGLKEAGCVALSNLDLAFKDSHVIKQCYNYAAGFNITAMVTPIDNALAHGGCMHEGPASTQMGLAGLPVSAETSALAQHLILCEETGIRLHISRVSSARALNMIIDAQQNGLPVTADVALANLVFTDENCRGYDSLMHVTPVYRSEADRKALLAGVNNGQLSICSNHLPQDRASKMAPFSASEVGINSLDNFMQVLLSLVEKQELTLSAAIKAITALPAAVINKKLGSIVVEQRADLCIVDMQQASSVSSETLVSKGSNNPWIGKTFTGKVTHTINGGHLVYSA
ncbi:dihydroorotase [Bermanella sp. WJH001]|uniref:dihydroorotase n=1 Tax=Bermanella sp. WJH001 TaxID=3048005 RepID=UPI0024BEBC32|nr:dihydroorotase [Bermanella sp. WJH001]MDJ1538981.1 dihydroorotase [Bermanella sp. WJH001]